jgi:hypothetical protein
MANLRKSLRNLRRQLSLKRWWVALLTKWRIGRYWRPLKKPASYRVEE